MKDSNVLNNSYVYYMLELMMGRCRNSRKTRCMIRNVFVCRRRMMRYNRSNHLWTSCRRIVCLWLDVNRLNNLILCAFV